MTHERDDRWAEPALSARDLLGDDAAPFLTYVDGDIYARNGVWTEGQWRPRPCGCGGGTRMPNEEAPALDFRDGVPSPEGCRCHLEDEDRLDWLALGGWDDGPMDMATDGCRVGLGSCRQKRYGVATAAASASLDRPWVDVYFSAGKRFNWSHIATEIGTYDAAAVPETPTRAHYRSCDDGNDRSCEIWRLRWYFDTEQAAVVEKVIGREDFGRDDWEPIALTRPAVSPDGRFLAYAYREWGGGNTFDDRSGAAVRVHEIGGPRADDNKVAEPLPWHGGIGWPAWMDDANLAVGAEMQMTTDPDTWPTFAASFKTVLQAPLVDTGRGMEPDGDLIPIRGPGVRYQHLDYHPLVAESEAIADMGVATDPHAHTDAKYGQRDRRGLRVASFGNRHNEDLGDAATTVVFDPTLDDPFGDAAETFRKPPETYGKKDESVAGLHHPTWNITGDMVQCSHQQSEVELTKHLTWRRGLHGFRWDEDDGQWVPWDGGEGRLFPNESTAASDVWWAGLPGTLEASSDGLPWWFPEAVTGSGIFGNDTEERCAIYVWKYGAFCGSDDYVVAQLACNNDAWATEGEFRKQLARSEDPAARTRDVSHLAQVVSRVVLIRLSDGFHWDLTSIVEAALAGDGPPFLTPRLFGLYPTCGALHGVLPGQFTLH